MAGVALAKYSFLYFNIFEDKREGRVQDPAYGGVILGRCHRDGYRSHYG